MLVTPLVLSQHGCQVEAAQSGDPVITLATYLGDFTTLKRTTVSAIFTDICTGQPSMIDTALRTLHKPGLARRTMPVSLQSAVRMNVDRHFAAPLKQTGLLVRRIRIAK